MRTVSLFTASLITLLAGCSILRVEDTRSGVTVTTKLPVWPWQDSTRALDRLNISSATNRTTVSVRGLEDATTGGTNIVDTLRALDSILGKVR